MKTFLPCLFPCDPVRISSVPSPSICSESWILTKSREAFDIIPQEPTIAIASYNVLADVYAQKFDPYLKRWSLRKGPLLAEIDALNADILCLQEVDHFYNFFLPEMTARGYDGEFQRRTGAEKRDGCATFWRRDRFLLAERVGVDLDKAQQFPLLGTGPRPPSQTHNVALICCLIPISVPPSSPRITDGKVTACSSRAPTTRRGLCVVNAHLFWDPEHESLKLAQAEFLVEKAEEMQGRHDASTTILAGDFNSLPGSKVYRYLSSLFSSAYVAAASARAASSSVPISRRNTTLSSAGLNQAPKKPTQSENSSKKVIDQGTQSSPSSRKQTESEAGATAALFLARDMILARMKEATKGEPAFTNRGANGFRGTIDYIFLRTHPTCCAATIAAAAGGAAVINRPSYAQIVAGRTLTGEAPRLPLVEVVAVRGKELQGSDGCLALFPSPVAELAWRKADKSKRGTAGQRTGPSDHLPIGCHLRIHDPDGEPAASAGPVVRAVAPPRPVDAASQAPASAGSGAPGQSAVGWLAEMAAAVVAGTEWRRLGR